jgi:phage terminase small subunit
VLLPRNADVQGSQLLGKLGAEIAAAQAQHLKRVDLTAEQVLRELARIGFSDVRSLFDENDNLRPIHSLDDHTAATISRVEQDALYSGVGKNRKQIGHTKKVKLWDKVNALRTLAQHLRLLEPDEQDRKRPLQIIITDAPPLAGLIQLGPPLVSFA